MKARLKRLLNPVAHHIPRWRWRIMKMDVIFPDGMVWFGKCLFAWDGEGAWQKIQVPLFVWGDKTLYRRWCNGVDRASN